MYRLPQYPRLIPTTNMVRSTNILEIALGYGLDDRGFESRQGLGTFLLTTASRPALELIQPPVQ